MAQPLIYGAVGPKGGGYLLEFTYASSSYTLRNPFSVLGGAASEVLSDGFTAVARSVFFNYPVGWTTYFPGQSGPEVRPFFTNGVEIELRYAGGSSSTYGVLVNLRPGESYAEIYSGQHSAAPDGELVVRIVCKPEILQIYAGGTLVHVSDPRTIDWGWGGPQPHYWMYLEVGTPFDPYSALDGLVSIDGTRYFFQSSRVPHIRTLSYSQPASRAAAFFRDFVKAYEIAGEGNGAAPPEPPEPPDQPGDPDNGTVLVLSAPPPDEDQPIVVESLPFQAIFNYSLGSGFAPPPLFMVDLAAGTYKFSTALSPDPENHDTSIALFSYDDDWALLYTNNDISDGPSVYDFRSEITATLAAGTYVLAVGTYGTEYDDGGTIDSRDVMEIPPGAVLLISKV